MPFAPHFFTMQTTNYIFKVNASLCPVSKSGFLLTDGVLEDRSVSKSRFLLTDGT